MYKLRIVCEHYYTEEETSDMTLAITSYDAWLRRKDTVAVFVWHNGTLIRFSFLRA